MNPQNLSIHPCEVYDMAYAEYLAAADSLEQAAPDPEILRHLTAIRAFAQIMDYSMHRTRDYRLWSANRQKEKSSHNRDISSK